MPSTFPGPRALKGSILVLDATTGQKRTVSFQYNPETLKRSLQPQLVGGEGRYAGAPEETFDLEVTIDAVDQLEAGKAKTGIHPQLAALETLLYPKSEQVVKNQKLLEQGHLEIVAYAVPLTILTWGDKRALPVRLTSYSVSEELFDSHLNPIRATVTLGLRALSYSDVASSHPAYHLFLAYQRAKEGMAEPG